MSFDQDMFQALEYKVRKLEQAITVLERKLEDSERDQVNLRTLFFRTKRDLEAKITRKHRPPSGK